MAENNIIRDPEDREGNVGCLNVNLFTTDEKGRYGKSLETGRYVSSENKEWKLQIGPARNGTKIKHDDGTIEIVDESPTEVKGRD